MSTIASALDAKELAVGKKKDKGGAKAAAPDAAGAEGDKPLSKKELNKL